MRTIRTVAELRARLTRAREDGRTVGLVPTMGAFHAGHHALIRAAREASDHVVVSLFVNPAQFNEAADLAAYPRDEARETLDDARGHPVPVILVQVAGEVDRNEGQQEHAERGHGQ